jgi:excisionase family DNA binding protein
MWPQANATLHGSHGHAEDAITVERGTHAVVGAVMSRYFSVRHAARYLGRSEKALYHLVARRDVPFIKQGRRLIFDRVALEKWMQRGKVDVAVHGAETEFAPRRRARRQAGVDTNRSHVAQSYKVQAECAIEVK